MGDELHREILVRCTVEHAFTTFTERIDMWWPKGHRPAENAQMHLEAQIEGRFYARLPDGRVVVLGAVVDVERPHFVEYTWTPGSVGGPTTVLVRFEREGEQTRVVVTHRNGAADNWSDAVDRFREGWSAVLPAFQNFAGSD